MSQVRLISWKPELARERASEMEAAGFAVNAEPLQTSMPLGQFRSNPPSVVLIDLDRLPSHGLAVGVVLRRSKSTRHIPLVFAGGLPEKVERVRRELPDAVFTDWRKAPGALKKALKSAPVAPVLPLGPMERYAGSPLVKKLGFPANCPAAVMGAPDDFLEKVGELPVGVEIQPKMTPRTRLAIWFVHSRRELEGGIEYMTARLPEGSSIWIAHPKQAGRYKVDFNQKDVRAAGLAVGLVDYKVCAVDEDWSALKFTRKLKPSLSRRASRQA